MFALLSMRANCNSMKPRAATPVIETPVNPMDDFYARLGKNIRLARERRGITQAALATLVDLTRSSVANVERGRQKLLAHTLARVCHVLAVSSSDLLPTPLTDGTTLDRILRDRPASEREWISKVLETESAR